MATIVQPPGSGRRCGVALPFCSFEDPADLLELLRSDNLALFRAIKAQPGSIDALAACLQRTHDVRRYS